MPTLAELQNAVNYVLDLPAIPAVLQLNSATRERAFEAYVFSLIVRAVRQAGGTATLYGRQTGENPTTVVFRGGPGLLGSDAQDYTYVACVLGEKSFEIHADVQYEGSSGAMHEIDVSVYDRAAAEQIRSTPAAIAGTKKLHGGIECKCYNGTLGTTLGRAFVGLIADCGTLQIKAFATNGHSAGLARYFGHGQRPDAFFGLSPTRPEVETRFVAFVEQALRKWAQVA